MIDVACVIHSNGYDWQYVQNLHNGLVRVLSQPFRFHVYTEPHRAVPPNMIKHSLAEWPGISGHRRSWWYKLQLFDSELFAGPLLYLDLDVVLLRPLDWIATLDTNYFWACRDFRYLQRSGVSNINSSVMWFDTEKFNWVWRQFQREDVNRIVKQFPGDQDYLQQVINHNQRRFFDDRYFQSYRWQVQGGGYDFVRRRHRQPDQPDSISGEGPQIDSPRGSNMMDNTLRDLAD